MSFFVSFSADLWYSVIVRNRLERIMTTYIKIVIVVLIILAVLIAFYLYSIKPGKRRDTSYFENKNYAHRGLHDKTVPENSLEAFRLAAEQGYGVELDVQMSKDGQLVVFHDGNLKRMCGVDGKLKNFTYEELSQLRLKDSEERIPLFSAVLETLNGMDLICEIKGDNGVRNYELCEKVYSMLKDYKGKFVIESFSPFLVMWFRKNHPEIIRGQLSCSFNDNEHMNPILRFTMSHMMGNIFSRPDFVAYKHEDVKNPGFRLVKKLYKPFLVAWTAKGDKQQDHASKHFDSVIFEKDPPESERDGEK